jgi:hypothetical protein
MGKKRENQPESIPNPVKKNKQNVVRSFSSEARVRDVAAPHVEPPLPHAAGGGIRFGGQGIIIHSFPLLALFYFEMEKYFNTKGERERDGLSSNLAIFLITSGFTLSQVGGIRANSYPFDCSHLIDFSSDGRLLVTSGYGDQKVVGGIWIDCEYMEMLS